jgi:hypothetical protein
MTIERKKYTNKIKNRNDHTTQDFGKRLHAYHGIWAPNEQFRLLASKTMT